MPVLGGVWKAMHLPVGEFALTSEAVAPGFEYDDMQLGECEWLQDAFPQHRELIAKYSKPRDVWQSANGRGRERDVDV